MFSAITAACRTDVGVPVRAAGAATGSRFMRLSVTHIAPV
jgi:hypothetical protein